MKIDEILNTLIETKVGDFNDISNDYSDILNKETRPRARP